MRHLVDLAVLFGAGLIIAGAAWMYLPLGLIVAGLIVLFFAVMGVKHGSPR